MKKMKLLSFLHKPKGDTDIQNIGYEPEERKTPILGRILLLILTFVLLLFGWTGLNDLRDIPTRPARLSSCFSGDTNPENFSLRSFDGNTRTCTFSEYEVEAGVPPLWEEIAKEYVPIAGAKARISSMQTQKRQIERGYDTSLLEDIAGQEALRNTPQQTRDRIRSLESRIAAEQTNVASLERDLRQNLGPLIAANQQAEKAFNWARHTYALFVFVLEMLFTLPLFVGALIFYRRLHAKSSPYTIIAVPPAIVAAILMARVILFYFWDLFLATLLEFFWDFFGAHEILRTILYYLGMGFAFLIFGGAVFLLQRKIYAPDRIRARRLRAQKCPHCELPLDLTQNYCPKCGNQILAKCEFCGQARYVDLAHCPACGKRADEAPESTGKNNER